MKTRVITWVILSFFLTGVVSAAGLWGHYKGNAIVNLKVGGADFKPAGVPAILFHNQPLLPLAALDKAGVKYTYDKKKQTIDLKKPAANPINGVVRDIGKVVYVMSHDNRLQVAAPFTRMKDEDADWDQVFEVFVQLSKLEADWLAVDYFDKSEAWLGTVSIERKYMLEYNAGKRTGESLADLWDVQGRMFRTSLTAKEIGNLMDRVGYVEAYDAKGETITTGSGFLVEGGLFFTNNHVVGESNGIRVKVGGVTYDNHGWYWIRNEQNDLFGTYLSTSYDGSGNTTGTGPAQFLSLNTVLPVIGDKVYAIGSPLGLENSLSDGIVSGFRTLDGVQYIQHTADIDHGSSGGVLLNEYGEVIGVTSAGVEGSNLEFAIPAKYVQQELDLLNE